MSRPALRRVARLGDGWAPAFVSDEELVAGIAEIRSQQSEFGRADAPLAVYYRPLDFPDPDEIRRLEDMGVTHCTVAPWGQDDPPPPLAHRLDGMKRFGDDVIAKLGDGGG